ncbi:MAG: hypothetical protein N3G21_09525 [Candidatus Hydrogenedentes bacterium]|nr:hypothetical protein [Candidatus Hydrogenedentota bacterium]
MIRSLLEVVFKTFICGLLFILYSLCSYSAPILEERISTGIEPSSKINRYRVLRVEDSIYGYVLVVMGLIKQGESLVRLEDGSGNREFELRYSQSDKVDISFYSLEGKQVPQTYIVVENKGTVGDIYIALAKKLSPVIGTISRLLSVLVWIAITLIVLAYLIRVNKISLRGFLLSVLLGFLGKWSARYFSTADFLNSVSIEYSNTILEYFLLKSLMLSIVDSLWILLLVALLLLYIEKRGQLINKDFSVSLGLTVGVTSVFMVEKAFFLSYYPNDFSLLTSVRNLSILSAGNAQSQIYLPAYIIELGLVFFPFSSAFELVNQGARRYYPSLVMRGMVLFLLTLYITNLFNSTGFYIHKPAWIHLLNLIVLNIASGVFYLSSNRDLKISKS